VKASAITTESGGSRSGGMMSGVGCDWMVAGLVLV
jgi:hypothetical protein